MCKLNDKNLWAKLHQSISLIIIKQVMLMSQMVIENTGS